MQAQDLGVWFLSAGRRESRNRKGAVGWLRSGDKRGGRENRFEPGGRTWYAPAMDELLKRITVEPGKCGGRPCIRGQRIRVSDVLELLAAGAGEEEILADYPFLEADDIRAALYYAARQTDHLVLGAA